MSHPPLLPEALHQHIAILGKTGAGKTTTAKVLVEYILDRGERVCVVDPVGVWWGLRLKRDGRTPAYPVVIFGGPHADLPIGRDHGRALAEIVGTTASPTIIDTSRMTVGERTAFFSDFAEAILAHNRAPLHLVLDEAHVFMPQGRVADPKSGRMVHASNNLVSLGRGRKIGIVLISQRPAKLHKDSLTQVETLIAHRLIAPQDRKAIEAWIEDQADPREGRSLIASLPQMKRGEAWVWFPEAELLQRRQFPPAGTFDSSRGLESDDEAGVLPPIDVGAINGQLEEIAAEAVANDPERLKARIAALEAEAAREPVAAAPVVVKERDEAAIETAYAEGQRAGRAAAGAEVADALMGRVDEALTALRALRLALDGLAKGRPGEKPEPRPAGIPKPPEAVNDKPHANFAPNYSEQNPPRKSRGAELRVLKVLAQRHPARFTRSEWATLAGLKKTGGTWGTYVSRLRMAGYLDERDGRVGVTPAGLKAVGAVPPAPTTTAELVQMWKDNLGGGAGRLLDILVKSYPEPMRRAVLAAHVRMEPTGGTFNTYLSRLRANGLLEERAGQIKANSILWSRP